jgi:hypothetical protein
MPHRIRTIAFGLLLLALSSSGCSSSASGREPSLIDSIQGMWVCDVVRTQNGSKRPWYVVFHGDGTGTYSSATNTTNAPGAGFTTRSGNAEGDWSVVGAADANFRAVELVYRNGNAAGRWNVDLTFHLRTQAERDAAPDHAALCTGSATGDACPTGNNARLTKLVFDEANGCECMNKPEGCDSSSTCLNNAIVSEVPVFNTTGNGSITAVIRCNALNDATLYGSSTKLFPVPAPTM